MHRRNALLPALAVLLLALAGSAIAAAPVELFSPQGEVKQVRQVTARFAEQMVAFGDPREVAPFDVDCPVSGSGHWVDGRNWSYDFAADLPAGVACRFTLKAGLNTLAGAPLPAGPSYTFSTGGPAVLLSLPYDGDERIDENQAFILGLDAPAKRAAIERDAYCAVAGVGERIPLRVIAGEERRSILEARRSFLEQYAPALFKSGGRTWLAILRLPNSASDEDRFLRLRDAADSPLVVVQCKRALPPEAEVKLVWGAGIESASGIARTQDQALSFKTRPAFEAKFRCERVNRKAQCIPMLPMRVEFSAPVAFLDAARIRLKAADGRVFKPQLTRNEAIDSLVDALAFEGPFPERSAFQLEVPANLRDDAGRTLVNARRFPLAVRTDENPPLAKFAARFGIIERARDAALPVTLRNVEARLSGSRVRAPAGSSTAGTIAGQVHRVGGAGGDMEIVAWLRRLRESERERKHWDAKLDREVIDQHAGARSIFVKADHAQRFVLPKPLGARAFEVVGIPLKQPGFHVVELASPRLGAALLDEPRPYYVHSAALVTNLAAHLKLGRENSLVWVTTLDKAQPVRNAAVTVRDCGGTVHFQGRTDGEGIARIDQALANRNTLPGCLDSYDKQYFVTVRAGDDMSFVFSDWNEGIAPWRFGVPTGAWEGPYLAHALFDRSLLRAGETVHMKLFMRRQTQRGFAAVPAGKLGNKVVIRHAGSDKEFELPVKWDATGIAETEWPIPADAKQGAYEVLVEDFLQERRRPRGRGKLRNAGTFRVEAFRVPTMKATLQGPKAPLVNADTAPVDIQLNYLAGGPAAAAPVKLRSLPQPKSVQFADYDGFVFANGDVKEGPEQAQPFSWRNGDYLAGEEETDEAPAAEAGGGAKPAATRSLTLDANGGARVAIGPLPQSDQPQDVQVEMEYRDANGETLTSSTRLALWPAAVVVGIKPESWAASRDHVKFQTIVLDLAGKPAAGVAVKVDLLLREQYSHRRRLLGGFYAYEHNTEIKRLGEGCAGVSDDNGLVFCDIASPKSGNLILRATAADGQGNRSVANREVWVATGEDWWFDVADNDRMDLLPEHKRYEPGDMARFQVRMPFPRATVLVAVEREGVIESFVRQVTRDKPLIELPVKGTYAPNVYVTALALRGRAAGVQPTALVDLGKPAFKMGLAEINVGWAAHELKVKVATDKTVYRVRDKALVTVRVRRADGSLPPAGSEIALAAVDEGLLELLPNDSWKLLEAMMKRRALEVETATAQMQVVGNRHYGRKALAAGGGGGRQSARELFDTLLFWKGRVKVDARGEASAEVPLNDSLTAFRLVAIASGGEDLFGSGAASIRSTQDVMLLSGLAPLARAGDTLRAGFTVRNATQAAMTLSVTATMTPTAADKALKASELAAQAVSLAAGEAREVGWEVVVPLDAERVEFQVKLRQQGGTAADAIKVVQKVVPALPVRTVQATIAQLDRPLSMAIRIPADAVPGRGGVHVRFQRRLADELPGVREYMSFYPYTCLEQRVSKAVALRDAGLWAQVTAGLSSYLDRDGLVKYFPSMYEGSDTLTAYLLAIADEAGWTLPEVERKRMLEAMQRFVEGRISRASALPTADLALRRLAAIEALSRYAVATQPQWLDSFSIEPNLWPTSALLDWYAILGRGERLPQRSQRLKEAETILRARLDLRGTTLGFSSEKSDALWWLMVSGDVNANRLVLAMLDNERWREDMPRLVRGALGRQQRGHWNTTTANAWGVLALERFSARFESAAVTGKSSATLGATRFERLWDADGEGARPSDKLLPWPSAPATLAARHEGTGHPWVTLQSLAAIALKEPLFSGYRIVRSVAPVEQRIKGRWSRGDVARVRLDLEAQSDMSWVVVSDPVPAGSRILGSGLGGDSQILARGEKKRGVVWPAFEERSFEAFRAYYQFVPKGKWTVEYSVRLNNAGEFQLPPTRVEAMYAPEMFGELPNERVMVKP